MKNNIARAILGDNWMMTESSLQTHIDAAKDYLAGSSIMDLFSKLELPAVPDNIALIPINGAMTKADICGGFGTRTLTAMINEAAADPSKESIILYFESTPGGQVDGTSIFADAIKAATKKKPVLSAISGMCASAGVWAASQSSEIYATSTTDQIGCIGVMARLSNPELDNKETITVNSNLSPDKNAEFKDLEILKNMYLDPVCVLFQDSVKAGRGDRLKLNSEKVLSGGTFISADAKKNGLIDGIMPIAKIIQRANFLSNKKNKETMSATKTNVAVAGNFPFLNVLTAAGAESFEPIEAGFALSEENLTALDARLVTLGIAESALNDATSTVATASARITELEATIAEKETAITALSATVAAYTGKPAPTAVDPTAKKDEQPDPKKKYLTSVDAEAARLYDANN